MKNTVARTLSALLAAVLLLPIAGCGQSGTDTDTESKILYPAPDYSDFVMPEETGELTVYTNNNTGASVMRPAVEIFEECYPDAKVNYEILGGDEFQEKIRRELSTGRGPDLVLFGTTTLPDPYKTMQTGLFCDLNPFFDTDEEISLDDFVTGVMDGGVMRGSRYIVPICYDVPLLLTTRALLNEVGADAESVTTFEGFVAAAKAYHEKHPDGTLFVDTGGILPHLYNLSKLYRIFGFQWIDYETGEVSIDEDTFREYIELVKLFYDPDYDEEDESKMDLLDGWYINGGALTVKDCLFDDWSASPLLYQNAVWYLSGKREKTLLLTVANAKNGVTADMKQMCAIPDASPNKLNAWRLLKIILSEKIQNGREGTRSRSSYFGVGYPVRRSSIELSISERDHIDDAVKKQFIEVVQSPTEAVMIPQIFRRYLQLEMYPYIMGEKSWEKSYKSFMNTLELYASE